MVIKDKMLKAINKQINEELFSAYLYLSMATYFDANNLPGFAHWMRAQNREETGHAMKFYGFVNDRGGKVDLMQIAAPQTEWKSPLAAFEDVLEHELKITACINGLLKVAKEENDTAAESMLKWFIDEQVEEEKNAMQIVDTLKMIKDSSMGLIMLDRQLAERK
ncbi:MAG TPA: ferritin [bacterium]|nr:ferritin [bacterium]